MAAAVWVKIAKIIRQINTACKAFIYFTSTVTFVRRGIFSFSQLFMEFAEILKQFIEV